MGRNKLHKTVISEVWQTKDRGQIQIKKKKSK